MKRLLTIVLTIFVALAFINISQAQKKQGKAKQTKESPCVADCNKERRNCVAAANKARKAEKKGKMAECNKALADCKANCDKPKEDKPKEPEKQPDKK